jgi:hypothetical protein
MTFGNYEDIHHMTRGRTFFGLKTKLSDIDLLLLLTLSVLSREGKKGR